MTQIQLEGYGFIDIETDTSFPLNFNIQNLLDTSSTPSSYSKDIKIVGTKQTNKILGQAFDVNISNSSFNVNKKVKCDVIQEGVSVFKDAYFQLIGVDKTGKTLPNGEDEILYTGRVKSNLMSFFNDIKAKELRDLTIGKPSDFHNLSYTEVESRMNNDATDRWKYLLHYIDSTIVKISDFKPAIFAKTYWDAIHEQNGWEYDFEEITDLRFDKLIIPSTEKYESSDELKKQESFIAIQTSKNIYPNSTTNGFTGANYPFIPNKWSVNYTFASGEIDKNPQNAFNVSNQRYTPNFVGNYTVAATFDYTVQIDLAEESYLQCAGDAESLVVDFYFEYVINGGGAPYGNGTWYPSNSIRFTFKKDEIVSAGVQNISTGNITLDSSFSLNHSEQITGVRMFLEINPGDANGTPISLDSANNARFIKTPVGNTNPGIAFKPRLLMSNIEFQIRPELDYNYGTPIYLDHYIPAGIKQRDFVKSIIDMYKLVVDVDPTQENKLIYKTRDKYYDEGRKVDWTKKLAKDRKINIEWLQDKQPKDLILSYKDDKDAINEGYFNAAKETYGQYRYTFDNEYNFGEERQEIIFSPTPIVKNQYTNMYLPAIPAQPDTAYNIRLLYDNGRRTDGYYFLLQDNGKFSNVKTDYPVALHLNDPINPSFDINFDQCAYYFFNDWEPMTQNNLFNLYHRRYIYQLTKGRIMTAFFYLTPTDILNFKLNDRIFIKDAWWNVNKIIDYNANKEQLTKVELVTVDDGISIKIKPTVKPVRRPVLTGNALGPIKPHPTDPIVVGPIRGLNASITPSRNVLTIGSGGLILGEGNVVNGGKNGPSNNIIIGDNNTSSGTNSLIIGNNNTDRGNSTKIIVGNNITADGKADIVARTIEAKSEVIIGNTTITENGSIVEISPYAEYDYIDSGYFLESSAVKILTTIDDITGESSIDLIADATTIDSDLFLPQTTENLTIKQGLVIDPSTNQVYRRNLIPAFIAYHDYNSASVTTISAANTWYKLNSDTSSLFSENGLVHSNNRITNNSGSNKIVQLQGIASLESGNGNDIKIGVFKGIGSGTATLIPYTVQHCTIGANNKAYSVPFQGIFELNNNEWVEVWVMNLTAAHNITLDEFNVNINEKLTT